MMAQCIFCDNQLDANTKPEHILLNALGGRMTTRAAICSECNNGFGSTIDKELTEQVEIVRNLLQLKSGTGKAPPGLGTLESGGQKVSFGSDGRPKLQVPPFAVTDRPDGNRNVEILVQNDEEMRRVLPHLAAKLRITVDELKRQIETGTAAHIEMHPNTVHNRLSLGGEKTLRSAAKSCFVLLATKVGTPPLRTEIFEAARNFVFNGSEEFSKTRISLDPRELPCARDLESEFGEFFNLIHVQSDENGRVIGHFTLYNAVGWQIVLADRGGPKNVKIMLASNPLNPANWSGSVADRLAIPFSWLNTVDDTDRFTRARDRFAAMLARHVDRSREAEIGRIVNSVCARYGIIGDDTPIAAEHVDAISREVSARVSAHAMKLPYEDKLSPARLRALIGIAERDESDH